MCLHMQVSTECQHYRKSRIGVDSVEDEVEAALVKEVDAIRDYQSRMKMLVELMVKQLDANNAAQKQLMTDLRNKVIIYMYIRSVKIIFFNILFNRKCL